jgi:hypothetical protein
MTYYRGAENNLVFLPILLFINNRVHIVRNSDRYEINKGSGRCPEVRAVKCAIVFRYSAAALSLDW